jgi:lysyl-tRNA synthetase class II
MKFVQPTFVTHLPKELVPLAKLSPAGKTVEGFVQPVLYFPA